MTPDKPGWDFGEDYYKGMITIPYRKNSAAIVDASAGQGATSGLSSLSDVQKTMQISGKQLNNNISAAYLK